MIAVTKIGVFFETTKGLGVFYSKTCIFASNSKATACQTLIPMTLFTENSLDGQSTPPLDAINQTITTLRRFSKSLPHLPESEHSKYLYAVDGKHMEKCPSIRNHLIK